LTQRELVNALETDSESEFQFALEVLQADPNDSLECFGGLSVFEKVLLTPNKANYIELCIYNGANFYKVTHLDAQS